MRSKLRKKKARRLSYRKNWKRCSTVKTRARLPLPFLQRSCALLLRFEAVPLTAFTLFGFGCLFLGLLLPGRPSPIFAGLPARRTHLRLTRFLSHLTRSAGRTSVSGCFARARFGLASPNVLPVPVIFGPAPVSVFLSTAGPLSTMFRHVRRFDFSSSRSSSLFGFAVFLTRPSLFTRALRCVRGLICSFFRSRRSPRSLCAFALLRACALVEGLDRVGLWMALIHRRLEIAILGCRLLPRKLLGGWRHFPSVRRSGFLFRGWLGFHAIRTIKAGAVSGHLFVYHVAIDIGVTDDGGIHAGHSGVVLESVPTPSAT